MGGEGGGAGVRKGREQLDDAVLRVLSEAHPRALNADEVLKLINELKLCEMRLSIKRVSGLFLTPPAPLTPPPLSRVRGRKRGK